MEQEYNKQKLVAAETAIDEACKLIAFAMQSLATSSRCEYNRDLSIANRAVADIWQELDFELHPEDYKVALDDEPIDLDLVQF